MALLSIDQVSVAYDKVEAVRGVSLAIEPGQIVTVIGPNGAGKTTLLGAAIGLLPWRGRMSFDGIDLRRLDVEARIERGFCLVPETRELFGDLSVSDNLLLGGYSRRRDSTGLKQSLADVYGRFPRLSERRNQLDLQINLLSEQENTKILTILGRIAKQVGARTDDDPSLQVLEQATRPEKLVDQIEQAMQTTGSSPPKADDT